MTMKSNVEDIASSSTEQTSSTSTIDNRTTIMEDISGTMVESDGSDNESSSSNTASSNTGSSSVTNNRTGYPRQYSNHSKKMVPSQPNRQSQNLMPPMGASHLLNSSTNSSTTYNNTTNSSAILDDDDESMTNLNTTTEFDMEDDEIEMEEEYDGMYDAMDQQSSDNAFKRVSSAINFHQSTLVRSGHQVSSTRKSSRSTLKSMQAAHHHNPNLSFAQQMQQQQQLYYQQQQTTKVNNVGKNLLNPTEALFQNFTVEVKNKPWNQIDKCMTLEEEQMCMNNQYPQTYLTHCSRVFNDPFKILKRLPLNYKRVPFKPTFENDGVDHSHQHLHTIPPNIHSMSNNHQPTTSFTTSQVPPLKLGNSSAVPIVTTTAPPISTPQVVMDGYSDDEEDEEESQVSSARSNSITLGVNPTLKSASGTDLNSSSTSARKKSGSAIDLSQNTSENQLSTVGRRFFLKLSELDKISIGQTDNEENTDQMPSPKQPRSARNRASIFGSFATKERGSSANLLGPTGSEKKALDGFDEIVVVETKKSLVDFARQTVGKKKTDQIENIDIKNNTVMAMKSDQPSLEVTTNDIRSQNRLMSCLKPDFQFKPLETTMCQRASELPYPVKRKTKFFLQCTSLKFESDQMKDREVIFCTMALFDIAKGKKLSEDYHFHLMNKEQLSGIPDYVKEDLKYFEESSHQWNSGVFSSKSLYSNAMITPKKLFSVSYPNDQIYLVATIYRIPTSSVKDATKMYMKDIKNIEKWTDQYNEMKNKLCRFRQPFLFGFTPLFTKETIEIKGKMVDTYKLTTARYDIKPLYEIEGDNKNPMDIIATIRNSLKEKKLKNNQINGSMLFTAELVSNSSTASNYEIHQRTLTKPKAGGFFYVSGTTPRGNNTNTDSESSQSDKTSSMSTSFSPSSTSSPLYSTSGFSSPRSFQDCSSDRKRSDASDLSSGEASTEQFQVQEIPWAITNYPNLVMQNTLFLYPLSFNIEKISNAKNIVIEVLLRDNDSAPPKVGDADLRSEKRIISYLKRDRSNSILTSMSYDDKQPQLFDEIRIELPPAPKSGHHLLFIFYHIDVDGKRNKKLEYPPATDPRKSQFVTSDRAIIGYSILPLTKKITVEESNYSLKENVIYCQELSNEITIYKKESLGNGYLTGELGKEVKNAKLKLRSTFVSTIHPKDETLSLFFAALSDLNSVSSNQKDDVLSFLANFVLCKFNQIDFSTFLPFFPVVLNLLFDLMCRVSELTADDSLVDEVERTSFEALLVCLRGSYHYTKHHTRSNKFFSSYVRYIFENVKGNPLFLNLPRIFNSIIKVPDSKKNEPAREGKYIEEMNKLNKRGRSIIRKPNLETEKKNIEHKKNEISPHDPIRFSWFLFDIVIKSLILSGVPTDSSIDIKKGIEIPLASSTNYFSEVSEDLFVRMLKSLLENYNTCVHKLMLSEGTGRNNIGLNGNRNLALFIRDLIPILKREHTVKLVKRYFKFFSGSDEKQLRLKSEFIAILSDYDYWVPLNNLSLSSGNFGIKHLCEVFYQIVDNKKDRLLKRMCKVLLNHFCKLDYDSRFFEDDKKSTVCEMYMPFVDLYFEKDEYLTCFQNDELFVVTSCIILWILRGLSSERLLSWWKTQPCYKILNVITFFDYVNIAINNLDYDLKPEDDFGKDDRSLRTEIVLVVNHLTSFLTSPQILNTVLIKELEMQNENIDLLTDIQINDPSLIRQRQLVSYYESKQLKTQTPVVGLFFRQVCRLLMNSVLQLTLRKEQELCYIVFRDSLLPLIAEYTGNQIVMSELYDSTIPKKERIPIAQKRRIEQKWRWLLGAVMLHSGFNSEEEEKAYPMIKQCQQLLLAPFEDERYHITLEDSTSEDGDLIINNDDNNIKAATFKKLVERLLDINTHASDKEGNKYSDIFLLTCASFTSPSILLQQLVEIFKATEDMVIKLRIEQFVSKWVRFGFHDFDNLAIAKLVSFLSNISGVTQKKIKKYIIKHFLHVKMDTGTDLTSKPPNPMIPNNIPKEKLEEPQMDIRKWKEAQKFTKQLDNPFDVKFELLDWPSREIARQLTIIESKLFRKIEPKEFFGSAWTDKEYKQELAPTLCAITDRTNNVSFWVRNKILFENNVETRKKIMKKFVDILRELKELRNYTSIIQITSAFNSAEIHRLRRTKEGLSKQDIELIEECTNLVNNNSKSLREQLERDVIINGAPAVPAISIYFTDLVFIEDGNPNTFDHKTNPGKKLINFQKRRLYYNTVNTIKTLQTKSKYSLQPLPYLHYILKEEILQNLKTDEKYLFDLSLKIEPRVNK